MGNLKNSNNNLFIEAITLGSERARVFVFFLGLTVLALIPTAKLSEKGCLCLFHNIIFPLIFKHRYYCFGCGVTHALSRIMHADFFGAYYYNKSIIVVFPLIIIIVINDLYRISVNKSARK